MAMSSASMHDNLPDNSILRRGMEPFARHSDSVLCCSIDNQCRRAVSGGIDDTAFVWDLETKHVVFECTGHKESVIAACFNVNSSYVATGDLKGYIQVRNTITGIKVFEFDVDEINWLMWHNSSDFILLAGTKTGDFWMWNVNDPSAIKTFPSYNISTTAAQLLQDGLRLVTTYSDGSVRLFDLKAGKAIATYNEPAKAEIISLDLNPHKAIIAVGCLDSTVKLLTVGTCKLICTLVCKGSEKDSNSELPKRSMQQGDGAIVEPDSETMTECQASEFNLTDLDANDTKLCDDHSGDINSEPLEVIDDYTNPLAPEGGQSAEDQDDCIEEYEESDEDEQMDVMHSVESVLFSPCGSYLAAANNHGSIYIFDVSTQVIRCELHTGMCITRCTWTDRGNYITGSVDGTIRIYDLNLNKLNELALHDDQILDVTYKNKILVTASEDKTCKAIVIQE